MDLADYLEARRAEVETALAEALPAPPRCPPVVFDAMRYSLLGGGKRLRPILVLAACEAVHRGPWHDVRALAMPAACAVELIHTYSLIHDDLPAMDDDSLRRGRPTSHVVHGEGMAILAGDGLQAEAFAILARRPDTRDPDLASRTLSAIQVIAEAAGAMGMVGGQALDLDAAPSRHHARGDRAGQRPPAMDAAALTDMHARKTGALIRASVLAGAIMGGAGPRVLDALDRYAREIGLAFQIVDDILDVEGASADLGKTAGKDAASGKPTCVSLYGLAESKALAAQCLSRAHAALDEAGLADTPLAGIARWIVDRRT
ncbi:MAG: polyprenyl synthetase family protein [Acidobacteria bacterium]|nr:polyprenyl synthetase family protein [Acidobacteriota bacterium]